MVASTAGVQSPLNFLLTQGLIYYRRFQYLSYATFSKHLLSIFRSIFCPEFSRLKLNVRDMLKPFRLIAATLKLFQRWRALGSTTTLGYGWGKCSRIFYFYGAFVQGV
jgi:hypothetical protein